MQKLQKALIMCLLLVWTGVFASAQNYSAQTSVSGTVLEQGTNVPVEFAVVILSPAEIYTTTDKDGNFEFKKVDPGKSTIKIQFVGMENIEQEVTIVSGKENVFNFKMKEANFRLEDVVVVAQQSKAGQSTASNISRQAMDHLQASSLGDVMQLLPGAAITNPSLSSASHITIRNGSTLGTSIIVDGAPISANSNMQALAPTISGATNGTQSGVDVRGISTDNIESIEIIRGIPSAEYGDMTSGAVIIRSRAGKEPLSVRVKANPLSYQGAVSKGLSLGEKGGVLNLSGDYAYNTSKLTEGYAYFQRVNAKALWGKKFSDRLNTNTSLDFGFRKDTRELNPDDQRNQLETSGSDKSIRFNTNGTININKGWLNTIKYTVSANYSDKYDYNKELLSNAEALHTTSVYDGAVLSNVPGRDVFDIEGNKLTNIPASEASKYVRVLPYEYISIYEILGKELNGYAQVKADFNKRWENVNNHILIGADYKTDGNLGEGIIYDEELPPMRPAASSYATYRRRPYSDIPFLHQIGVFAEDTYKQFFGEREMNVKVGARFDWINGKTAISPRFNASFDVIPNVFVVRGGWGMNAKAPTALYLYPEKAYFNYNNYFYEAPDGSSSLVSTNRVFETSNPDLEIAKLRRAEVGFDLTLFERYRLSVTAYDDLMKNGYGFGSDLSTFQLVPFAKYNAVQNAEGQYVPQLEGIYNIFSTFTRPRNKGYNHNRGIEFELDLGRFDAIRTSFYLNGAYGQLTDIDNTGYTFGTNSNSNKIEKNIAIYEESLYTYRDDFLRTILRITHNIPELGFVLTLATQVNWLNKSWTEYGNDEMFIKYISYKDGKVYDFDPNMKSDPEFAYMFSARSDTRFIAESYFPTVTFNFNLSKEIGDILTASFFVNNMFNSRPLYESKKSPGSFSELSSPIFFGFDLKVNIK